MHRTFKIRMLLLLSVSCCLLLVVFNLRKSFTWQTSNRNENHSPPGEGEPPYAHDSARSPSDKLAFSSAEPGNHSKELPLKLEDRLNVQSPIINITVPKLIDASGLIQPISASSLAPTMSHTPDKTEQVEKMSAAPLNATSHTNESLSINVTENKSGSQGEVPPPPPPPPPPPKPLNILILYPDDWRHDTIGAAGKYPVKTPFLDSLATEGIRFTHNCVTTSVCWISRATLFTGQYLSRHRSDDTINPVFYQQWNETWPHLLRNAGYWTGHIGKWQFANYTFVEEQFNYTYLLEGYHWWPNPNWKPGDPHEVSTTDIYMNQTIDFIRNRPKDRQFALTVAFYAPKAIGDGPDQWFPKNESLNIYENMTIPEPLMDGNTSFARLPAFFKQTEYTNAGRTRWVDRFGSGPQYQRSMKRYFALITEVDIAIGNIYKELEDQGILNETLIVFTTDNGFFLGEHGLGGKWWPYQESIRVPLIVRDPRMPKEKVGVLDDSFTLNIDLAPTILNAANVKVPPGMQGRNIADLYMKPEGKQSWRKEFYYEHPTHYGVDHIPASTALVRKDYKYMEYPDWNVTQLFDLTNDPYEYNDIVNNTDYTKLVDELKRRHDELKLEVLKPPVLT